MTTKTRAHAGAAFPYPFLFTVLAILLALLASMAGAPSDQDAAEATAADLHDAVLLAKKGGAA